MLKLCRQFLKRSIRESSDIWETLGLQALERCEMTMAYGLLHLVGNADKPIYLLNAKNVSCRQVVRHLEKALCFTPAQSWNYALTRKRRR